MLAAAASEALTMVDEMRGERTARLKSVSDRLHQRLLAELDNLWSVEGAPMSPIKHLRLHRCTGENSLPALEAACAAAADAGLLLTVARYVAQDLGQPAQPSIRLSVNCNHSDSEIGSLLDFLKSYATGLAKKCFQQLNISRKVRPWIIAPRPPPLLPPPPFARLNRLESLRPDTASAAAVRSSSPPSSSPSSRPSADSESSSRLCCTVQCATLTARLQLLNKPTSRSGLATELRQRLLNVASSTDAAAVVEAAADEGPEASASGLASDARDTEPRRDDLRELARLPPPTLPPPPSPKMDLRPVRKASVTPHRRLTRPSSGHQSGCPVGIVYGGLGRLHQGGVAGLPVPPGWAAIVRSVQHDGQDGIAGGAVQQERLKLVAKSPTVHLGAELAEQQFALGEAAVQRAEICAELLDGGDGADEAMGAAPADSGCNIIALEMKQHWFGVRSALPGDGAFSALPAGRYKNLELMLGDVKHELKYVEATHNLPKGILQKLIRVSRADLDWPQQERRASVQPVLGGVPPGGLHRCAVSCKLISSKDN
uniref:PI3K/PI4K domain-containing protein n=1 Tax=Macrostomum lignano TaxID=282301 RepID=A0A1I8F6D6_9PLAT